KRGDPAPKAKAEVRPPTRRAGWEGKLAPAAGVGQGRLFLALKQEFVSLGRAAADHQCADPLAGLAVLFHYAKETAPRHDGDAIAKLEQFVEFGGNENAGRTASRLIYDRSSSEVATLQIQTMGRLVVDDDLRVPIQFPGQQHLLDVSARQARDSRRRSRCPHVKLFD